MQKKLKIWMEKWMTALLSLILMAIVLLGCTEEIDIGSEFPFEDALVVEASITSQEIQQRIALSRTFRFEADGPLAETGAQVSLLEDGNLFMTFYEEQPGFYLSQSPFKPEAGKEYQLQIVTQNGRSYVSTAEILPTTVDIEKLYVTRERNSVGTEIMSFNVDSFDPKKSANYYRYEYEEAYNIIAPNWVSIDFVLNAGPEPVLGIRSEDQKTCYKTSASKSIIQTSTVNLNEDRVSKFAVRTIASDDPIISHRYSILVKQFVQSAEAYTYFNILDQLSGTGNLFSTLQPGFIPGNIRSAENSDEKVIGFFELTTVSEKRIFVNYRDLFPTENRPPYFTPCSITAPLLEDNGATPLRDAIESGWVKYLSSNSPSEFEGPYRVVPTPCGDCRVIGSNEKPEFWED